MRVQACSVAYGGCSKGPCKERAIWNTLPYKGILTKQGTYIMAISGTSISKNTFCIFWELPWHGCIAKTKHKHEWAVVERQPFA